ncbi:gephyrin-like molybdotransferase Glp [Nakamurella aerolata]|uniref:molybdopterin molybdotransferase MoeA n=1 Tax=Nakamurella aerolata TaxID=1656892 RepID=UPI0031B5EBC1
MSGQPLASVADHAARIAQLLPRTAVERRALSEARGLALAHDVVARVTLPPFDNSSMDGFAVAAADIGALPVELVVSQDIPAGVDPQPLQPGTAARIMTGAPVPPGADSIVPVEQTSGRGTDGSVVGTTVRLHSVSSAGQFIRRRGSDVTEGDVVLPAGTVLTAAPIGLLAAIGVADVQVHRPLSVLVLSTGSELVAPGEPLRPGQIYESNGPMLAAALAETGAVATLAHFVADDVPAFLDALGTAVAGAANPIDLIVTSGGVSAGAFEVVKQALADRGVSFTRVAMQPGMPQGSGRITLDTPDDSSREIPVVTLPGNPVSSFVSFEVFLRPAIRAAQGFSAAAQHRPKAALPLAEPLTSVPGKAQFRRATRAAGTVRAHGGASSHLLAALAHSDSLIEIPADVTDLPAGAEVTVWDLSGT